MASFEDKKLVDSICDLLIEENLEVAFVARTGNPEKIRTIVQVTMGRKTRFVLLLLAPQVTLVMHYYGESRGVIGLEQTSQLPYSY